MTVANRTGAGPASEIPRVEAPGVDGAALELPKPGLSRSIPTG